jgi:hypothetical protein
MQTTVNPSIVMVGRCILSVERGEFTCPDGSMCNYQYCSLPVVLYLSAPSCTFSPHKVLAMVSETRRRHLVKQQIANAKPYDPLSTPEGPALRDDQPEEWEGKFWFGEAVGKFLGDALSAAWISLRRSPLAQALWRTWIVQYLFAVYVNVVGVFFQVSMARMDHMASPCTQIKRPAIHLIQIIG